VTLSQIPNPSIAAASWSRRIGEIGRRNQTSFGIGLFLISAATLAALLAGVVSPRSPFQIETSDRLQGPSFHYLLGTDELGRDVLSRTLFAARISLGVGGLSVLVGLLVGVSIGAIVAMRGGLVDQVVMRLLDVLYAFPAILLAIAAIASFGTSPLATAMVIGVTFVPAFARVARATTSVVLREQFIDAARAMGMNGIQVFLWEVLPNILGPVLVQTSQSLAWAVLIEASLSFIGLGAPAPVPSWGNMLSEGQGYLSSDPWMMLAPGLALFLTILGFNLAGDGLRDRLDPRS